MSWICSKCHARNGDVTNRCPNCHTMAGEGGGCGKMIIVGIVFILMASAGYVMYRKHIKNGKMPGGPRVRIVRPREE